MIAQTGFKLRDWDPFVSASQMLGLPCPSNIYQREPYLGQSNEFKFIRLLGFHGRSMARHHFGDNHIHYSGMSVMAQIHTLQHRPHCGCPGGWPSGRWQGQKVRFSWKHQAWSLMPVTPVYSVHLRSTGLIGLLSVFVKRHLQLGLGSVVYINQQESLVNTGPQ